MLSTFDVERFLRRKKKFRLVKRVLRPFFSFILNEISNGFLIQIGKLWVGDNQIESDKESLFVGAYERQSSSDKDTTCC